MPDEKPASIPFDEMLKQIAKKPAAPEPQEPAKKFDPKKAVEMPAGDDPAMGD